MKKYFEEKHMIDNKAEMKKHVDADSNKGWVYIKDKDANKCRKSIEKNDEDELVMIEAAKAWCSKWDGLDLGELIREANNL